MREGVRMESQSEGRGRGREGHCDITAMCVSRYIAIMAQIWRDGCMDMCVRGREAHYRDAFAPLPHFYVSFAGIGLRNPSTFVEKLV